MAALFRVTRDERYLGLLREWQAYLPTAAPIAVAEWYQDDADLSAGHALLGLALAYDALAGVASSDLVGVVQTALERQAEQTYHDCRAAAFYPYDQNHFTIPVSGLLLAALALDDQRTDTQAWRDWSRTTLRRSLDCMSEDGWYYEGFTYWSFSFQFIVAAADALQRIKGEDWFIRPPLSQASSYAAQMNLPGGRFAFDFADSGPRADGNGGGQKGYKAPWHTVPFSQNLSTLQILQSHVPNRALATYLRTAVSAEKIDGRVSPWRLDVYVRLLRGENWSSAPLTEPTEEPTYRYFPDMGVIHWRSSWDDPAALAVALKAGPPAGHAMTAKLACLPEWRPSLGHVHPDAGSFIIFARGVFLAGDTGYSGIKKTADHNTLLVDDQGQTKDGTTWETFTGKPYSGYDAIRFEGVRLGPRYVAATAEIAAAYDDALALDSVRRNFLLVDGRWLVIDDRISSRRPHRYQWGLHTDQPIVNRAPGSYEMENGPARLVVQSFGSDLQAAVGETAVETSLEPAKNSQRVHRGYYLTLTSPRQKTFELLTILCVEGKAERSDTFRAELTANTIHLRDGDRICSIGLDAEGKLDWQGEGMK